MDTGVRSGSLSLVVSVGMASGAKGRRFDSYRAHQGLRHFAPDSVPQ